MSYRLIDANAIAEYFQEVNDMPCIYADLSDGLDGRLYDLRETGELQAENERLRELVSDMWRFTGAACKKYPRLFDPAAQGGQMVQLNHIDSFEQRMRELRVEVSHD